MAEVEAFRNNQFPAPLYACPYAVKFLLMNETGGLVTGATGLDSKISFNGDTFVDCVNEAVEIGLGWYYLILDVAETLAQTIAITVSSTTPGCNPTPLAFNVIQWATVYFGTLTGGLGNQVFLPSGASDVDDVYNNLPILLNLDGVWQARKIYDYTGSTRSAFISPGLTAVSDSSDTFTILMPIGIPIFPTVQTTSLGTIAIVRELLKHDWTTVSGEADRSVLNALRLLRNKWDVSGGVLTVKKENDSTTAWTAPVSSDAAAVPIIGIDPS